MLQAIADDLLKLPQQLNKEIASHVPDPCDQLNAIVSGK